MEVTQASLTAADGPTTKRQCIRVKAHIKIYDKQQSLELTDQKMRPLQAYCETVTSSRSQSPEIFTTPPTHSGPFEPVRVSEKHKYTARITTRKTTASTVLANPFKGIHPEPIDAVIQSHTATENKSKGHVEIDEIPSEGNKISGNQYHAVIESPGPYGSRSGEVIGHMSRNRTPSLSQAPQANRRRRPTTHIAPVRTPLRQKRYGRMEYHPLPPLPPSPPETLVDVEVDGPKPGRTAVNFSRGEIRRKSPPLQEQATLPRQMYLDDYARPPTQPLPVHNRNYSASTTAGHERRQSKKSRRTVTFADDTHLSSRSLSPVYDKQVHSHPLRHSKSFSYEAQVPSSLRLYRSHDSLLAASNEALKDNSNSQACRRTTPKDFKHRYPFGERPRSRILGPDALGRTSKPSYNPRLSTSKAQYRGLSTLPRPPPPSLRATNTRTGPRQAPWGSLEDLEQHRGKRIDARERDQAKQFRSAVLSAALSQATTVGPGSTDSLGQQEKIRREVEEYKEQVMSVYPDMAFDGNAGKGGRSRCCAVM